MVDSNELTANQKGLQIKKKKLPENIDLTSFLKKRIFFRMRISIVYYYSLLAHSCKLTVVFLYLKQVRMKIGMLQSLQYNIPFYYSSGLDQEIQKKM